MIEAMSKSLHDISGTAILKAVRAAVWAERLAGWYTYDEACDVLDVLLKARNEIRLEDSQ